MKLIADTFIDLPFKLDICAIGPEAPPLRCQLNDMEATLYFPPSMSEGTDGKGIFGDWAWWTGTTLRLVLEAELAEIDDDDVEDIRTHVLTTGDEILRRFLNSYRWRMERPDVHPVRIESKKLTLTAIDADGKKRALPEPISAFFYQNMPKDPPLERSVNDTTLANFLADVNSGQDPPLSGQLRLDADLLDSQGETKRAALIRTLVDTDTQL